ncbi:putative mitochondrial large ribosomal subunit [Erysiphe necator]|uniref:Large ribosomal subunit protein mL49 n=1 Tax=Uncinula necator TaxID=52586 RepID=A0A0B1P5M8_UNCNE|nr:putative mitochondrial large ribosomal subunit [Erysiphe necator]
MALRLLAHPAHLVIPRYIYCAHRFQSHLTTLNQVKEPLAAQKTSINTALKNNLGYKVERTPSNQLPIYHLIKNGGNKKITRIRKIQGNLQELRNDLRKALNLTDKECTINSTTGHVLVKGHKKQEISKFLTDQNF